MITAQELFDQLRHLETIADLSTIGVVLTSCHCDDHECNEGIELLPPDDYWSKRTSGRVIRLS